MKKGDCIIWAANLLHGSPERKNTMLQRKSQVTHWSFSDVKIHYNPNFSIPSKGKFTERKVTYF
jgi:ectoine hydroxylase-related dioxygenase (phytanoyl-CoA dioxygenase family)